LCCALETRPIVAKQFKSKILSSPDFNNKTAYLESFRIILANEPAARAI
jgi:hypothetical protein